jgi:MoaA/NifB/PqqE/SkfB family radical SAM enzyme
MKLTGLHILLTYCCTFECDHCFVWGSPWQSGVLTLQQIRYALNAARETGTVEWIYFEGGEPFLYYPVLLQAVKLAHELGFKVGIVTNAYWATGDEDALCWLAPFAGLIQELTASSDLFHYNEKLSVQVRRATTAAQQLDLPCGVISIAQPDDSGCMEGSGQLLEGESGVMYRGRAAEKLSPLARQHPWGELTQCPHEDLLEPGRVHLDPLGYLHVCQGIVIGNLFQTPLKEICQSYDPLRHQILGPLLENGPVGLVERYALPHQDEYADACHLCYQARSSLRSRFPNLLTPDQMYGVITS